MVVMALNKIRLAVASSVRTLVNNVLTTNIVMVYEDNVDILEIFSVIFNKNSSVAHQGESSASQHNEKCECAFTCSSPIPRSTSITEVLREDTMDGLEDGPNLFI